MIFAGDAIDERRSLAWAIAGFVATGLAPAAGLAPELPGSGAGDLVAPPGLVDRHGAAPRRSPCGRSCARQSPVVRLGAVVVLLAPHVIGAPHPHCVRKQGAGRDRRAVRRPVAGRAGPVVGARRDRGRPALADLCAEAVEPDRVVMTSHDSSSASRAAASSATAKSRSISPAVAWRKRSEPACRTASRRASTVTPVDCLAVLQARPARSPWSRADKWTYLIGDLDPDSHVDEIVAAARASRRRTTASCPGANGPRRSARA